MKVKREIREKRKTYLTGAMRLRELSAPCGDYTDRQLKKIRVKQKELYDKWRFYDGLIKAGEKKHTQDTIQD
jgi:hypothetical protein